MGQPGAGGAAQSEDVVQLNKNINDNNICIINCYARMSYDSRIELALALSSTSCCYNEMSYNVYTMSYNVYTSSNVIQCIYIQQCHTMYIHPAMSYNVYTSI